MRAQQRWDVETIRAKRRSRRANVGQVGPNLVQASAAQGEGADIEQNIDLCKSPSQLCADDLLVAKSDPGLGRWRRAIVDGRTRPLRTTVAGCATESRRDQTGLAKLLSPANNSRIAGAERSVTGTHSRRDPQGDRVLAIVAPSASRR